jgi:hypothetical protein
LILLLMFPLTVIWFSVVVTIATIVLILYEAEIRSSVHGKMILCFLSSLIVVYLQIPLEKHDWMQEFSEKFYIFLMFGFFSACFWWSLLSFEAWLSFRCDGETVSGHFLMIFVPETSKTQLKMRITSSSTVSMVLVLQFWPFPSTSRRRTHDLLSMESNRR